MKTKLERFTIGPILAPILPLAGFMLFWWLSYTLLPERWMPFGTLAGLLLGILADFFLIKRLIARLDQLGILFWVTVFLFYTVGVFGMFMGVPVFNLGLAVPAGFVVGSRLARAAANPTRVRTAAQRTAFFTTLVLALVCVASAFFALSSSSTAADLEGMLGLGFEVTPAMIWGLILVGGAGLLAVNWALTWLSVCLTHRFLGTP
jgi:hypothetical protein